MLGQVVAPLVGAVVVLVSVFGLEAGAPASIAIGLLVWAGIWFLDRVRRQQRSGGEGRSTGQNELMAAASRVETLRAAAMTVKRTDHRSILMQIVDSAGAMLDEAFADKDKRRRYSRALGHRLWHVEALATRIVGLERAGQPNAELLDRATDLLHRLASSLEQTRQRAMEADEQDLDIRLDVIEREMDAELKPKPQAAQEKTS